MLFSLGDISLKRQLTVTDTINTIMKQFNCVAVLNESPVVQTVFTVINFLTSLRHQVNIISPTNLIKLFFILNLPTYFSTNHEASKLFRIEKTDTFNLGKLLVIFHGMDSLKKLTKINEIMKYKFIPALYVTSYKQ